MTSAFIDSKRGLTFWILMGFFISIANSQYCGSKGVTDANPVDSVVVTELFSLNGVPLDSLNTRVCLHQQPGKKRISTLNLSGLGLENLVLPSKIKDLDSLFTLILSFNSLDHLPEEIEGFTRLRYLLANNNLLTSLPEALGRMSQLEMLDLQTNLLVDLSAPVFNLNIETWDTFGDSISLRLCRVRGLYVEGNRLCNLSPEAVTWLDSMYSFQVSCVDSATDWRDSQDCTDQVYFRQGERPAAIPEYYLTYPGWERFSPWSGESKAVDVRGRVLKRLHGKYVDEELKNE